MTIKETYAGRYSQKQIFAELDFLAYNPVIKIDKVHNKITFTDPDNAKNTIVVETHGLVISGGLIVAGSVEEIHYNVKGKEALSITGLDADASGINAALAGGTTGLYDYLSQALEGDLIAKGDKYGNLIEIGGTGTATVTGGGGDDQIEIWNAKNAAIDGGDGNDVVEFLSFTGTVPEPAAGASVNLMTGHATNPFGGTLTLANIENITGSTKADTIIGNDGRNIIGDGFFDGGADIVDAKGGNDLVRLGFDSDGASVNGGDGNDELQLVLPGDADFVLDASDPDNVTTSSGGYTIKNFEAYSINLDIYVGNYIFTFWGSGAGETVTGSSAESSNGGALAGRDRLHGGGGGDRLNGISGNDQLWGDGGDDTLVGGKGADAQEGGTGADTFLYLAVADARKIGAAQDVIADFSSADGDRFDFSAIDANSAKAHNQAFHFIGAQGFHDKAGELHIVKSDDHVLIEGDVNGDGTADFSVYVDVVTSLSKGDFHL